MITEFDRMNGKISISHNDILHSSSDYHSKNGPRTFLESDLRQKYLEVELKNLETGIGVDLGPSGILENSTNIDDSEETMQDRAIIEENWKEKYRIQKEKERKIMRGIERGKERELEIIEEREKEKAIEKEKERWEGREKVKDYRRIVEMRKGNIIGLDRVIEAEAGAKRAVNIGIEARSYDENENIKPTQEWEKEEEEERKKEQNRERDMKAQRVRNKEKDREERKKREKEIIEEEDNKNKREMKQMKWSKNITQHTTGAENGIETETEGESSSSLHPNSRVISLTPSSSTATISSSSSSSSSSFLLRSATTLTPTSTPTSTSTSTSNSATLSNPSSSVIPPIASSQDTRKLIDRTLPSIDEIELEKVFRKNFDDIFRKIIYETLETIKKEKNP